MRKEGFIVKYYPELGVMGFKILNPENVYPCVWEDPNGRVYTIEKTRKGGVKMS